MSSTNDQLPVPSVNTENFVTIRLLYHLWRVDSAARAFPHELTEGMALAEAKARWTIGLTLEMVCFSFIGLHSAHD